ncbi:MAG: phosphoribosyltransferase family protein [Porphyromonas sp.]|nr:phosphoribosyltransferase family protein [Porphyromonas sp.]
MKEVVVHGRTFELYLRAEEIAQHVKAMAARIKEDYQGKNPLLVCIMNGSFMFAGELAAALDETWEMAFARYSSYSGTQSTCQLNEVMPVDVPLEGRSIIIVEDLIDTGFTMRCVRERFLQLGATDVAVAALFSKPEAHTPDLEAEYVAMSIENRFILGHGLDYDGYGRMLNDLYQLKD